MIEQEVQTVQELLPPVSKHEIYGVLPDLRQTVHQIQQTNTEKSLDTSPTQQKCVDNVLDNDVGITGANAEKKRVEKVSNDTQDVQIAKVVE